MKRIIIMATAFIIVCVMSMTFIGCAMNESQIKTVAQTAGTGSAVAWIAAKNPDRETMNLVLNALNIVQSNLTAVTTDSTYTETLYPKIVEYVRSDAVESQYEPLILASSMATLQAVDVFFVMYPEWKTKETATLAIVNCFIIGAKTGFAMVDDDQILIEARKVVTASVTARRQVDVR